jgi:hypothetical protein
MAEILRMGMARLGMASTQILRALSNLPYVKLIAAADVRKDALALSTLYLEKTEMPKWMSTKMRC